MVPGPSVLIESVVDALAGSLLSLIDGLDLAGHFSLDLDADGFVDQPKVDILKRMLSNGVGHYLSWLHETGIYLLSFLAALAALLAPALFKRVLLLCLSLYVVVSVVGLSRTLAVVMLVGSGGVVAFKAQPIITSVLVIAVTLRKEIWDAAKIVGTVWKVSKKAVAPSKKEPSLEDKIERKLLDMAARLNSKLELQKEMLQELLSLLRLQQSSSPPEALPPASSAPALVAAAPPRRTHVPPLLLGTSSENDDEDEDDEDGGGDDDYERSVVGGDGAEAAASARKKKRKKKKKNPAPQAPVRATN